MATDENSAAVSRAVSRVGRNATILAVTTVVCKAGSLAVVPFILRAFSMADYGLYSTAFAYAGLLSMVAYFGMNPIVVRDISRGERSKGSVVFHCAALRMALLVPAAGILVALGWVKGFSGRMWALTWLAFGAMGLDAITGAIKASMQGQGRFGQLAAVDAVRKSAQWLLAIAVVLTGAGIVVLAGAVAVAAMAAFTAAWVMGISRKDLVNVSFAPSYAVRMLRLAWPLGISAAFVIALDNIDIWLVDWLKGDEAVAVYKAANVFKPVFLAQAVVWAFMPLAFRLASKSRDDLARAGAVAGRYLLIGGAAAAIVFFCGAGGIVRVLAGDKYEASIPVFRVMALSLPPVFTGFLYLHILTAVDKQIYAAFIFAGGLAVNAVMDLVLVPAFGPLGAMLGTLVAQILLALASLAAVWKVVGSPFDGRSARVLAALAAAIPVAILTQRLSIADMGTGALAVFVILLVVLKAVTGKDIALAKRTFAR